MKIKLDTEIVEIYWGHIRALAIKGINIDEVPYSYRTSCSIKINDKVVFSSYAYCSKKDQFSKKKGRKISLTRALEFFVEKEVRKIIWQEYFKQWKIISKRIK